jgi:Carboxylesterase family
MEYRHLTLCLLPIIISVQSIGVILILIAWYIRRKKRTNYSHLWPEEEFPTSNNSDSNSSNAFEVKAKMTSQDQEDTVTLNLAQNGYLQGVKIRESQVAGNASSDVTLTHYFGGVRYALPPSQRWGIAQALPSDYSYGTKEQPGNCDGRTVTCPQPYAGDEGSSEDCFQCNIWTPVGERPAGGVPINIYIYIYIYTMVS